MRKTKDVTIEAEGRDKGKTFRLTEMSAAQAEKWAVRAFQGLAKSGVALPDDFESAGLAGIAVLGFQALGGMDYSLVEPLMDEMMGCVQIKEPALVRALIGDDIEEIRTRLLLRAEVFELITGFSLAAVRSRAAASIAATTRAA